MSYLREGRTGYEAGLLQDDHRRLFQWFAGRMDARWLLIQKNIEKPVSIERNIEKHCAQLIQYRETL